MVRTIAMLIAAITMSRPAIPKDEATRYAKVLNEIGSKHSFDPLLAVAMIHHESHWYPAAASDDGEDYGLGQVRARYVGACRDDEDPVNNPSEACKAVKAQLLTGEANIRHVGSIIGANKKMCTAKRGKNKPEYWIAGYQGLSKPERNKYCIPGPTTTRVITYHKELLAALFPPPKKRNANAKAIAKTPGKGASAKKGVATAKKGAAAKATAAKSGAAVKAAAAKKKATPAPKKTAATKPAVKRKAPTKTAHAGAPAKPNKPVKKPKQAAVKPAPARHR